MAFITALDISCVTVPNFGLGIKPFGPNTLPILPYEKTPYVFDPASYGQYFGGTAQKPRKVFSMRIKEEHHIVGREILSKRIKPKMINNEPYVFHNDEKYKIANLHIHSKQLNKFLPNNYKNYA